MSKTLIDRMVDRFLGWKLPTNFVPDGGVSFKPLVEPDSPFWPVGTNLLTGEQARAMFEHCTAGEAVDRQARNAAIFNEWARRYAANPDLFGDILDADGKPVVDYGKRCAVYFDRIADDLDNGVKGGAL